MWESKFVALLRVRQAEKDFPKSQSDQIQQRNGNRNLFNGVFKLVHYRTAYT